MMSLGFRQSPDSEHRQTAVSPQFRYLEDELKSVQAAIRHARHRLQSKSQKVISFNPVSPPSSTLPKYQYELADKCNALIAQINQRNSRLAQLQEERVSICAALSDNKRRLHKGFDYSKNIVRPTEALKSSLEYQIREAKLVCDDLDREDRLACQYMRFLWKEIASKSNQNQPVYPLRRFKTIPFILSSRDQQVQQLCPEMEALLGQQQQTKNILNAKAKLQAVWMEKTKQLNLQIKNLQSSILQKAKILKCKGDYDRLFRDKAPSSNRILKFVRAYSKNSRSSRGISSDKSTHSLDNNRKLSQKQQMALPQVDDQYQANFQTNPYKLNRPKRVLVSQDRPKNVSSRVILGIYRPKLPVQQPLNEKDTHMALQQIEIGKLNDSIQIGLHYSNPNQYNGLAQNLNPQLQFTISEYMPPVGKQRQTQANMTQGIRLRLADISRLQAYYYQDRICAIEATLKSNQIMSVGEKYEDSHVFTFKAKGNNIKAISSQSFQGYLQCLIVSV